MAAPSGATSAVAAAVDELRLPPFFPRAPKACKVQADAFFECFNKHSVYVAGQDPAVGRKALVTCRELMAPYEACVSAHLSERQKELVRAPQLYLAQAANAPEAKPSK